MHEEIELVVISALGSMSQNLADLKRAKFDDFYVNDEHKFYQILQQSILRSFRERDLKEFSGGKRLESINRPLR